MRALLGGDPRRRGGWAAGKQRPGQRLCAARRSTGAWRAGRRVPAEGKMLARWGGREGSSARDACAAGRGPQLARGTQWEKEESELSA
jgi:hypothetical protein